MEKKADMIPIVYAVDGNEVYLKYLVNSLKSSSKFMDYKIFVLHDGLPKQTLDKISIFSGLLNKIDFIDVGDFMRKNNTEGMVDDRTPNLTAMTFARLFIPLIDDFFKFDRVVYVDVDTEIVGDVAAFAEKIDMDDFEVAMTFDDFPTTVAGYTQMRITNELTSGGYTFTYSDVTGGYDYCNAGVSIFNLAALRRTNYRMRLLSMFDMMKRCKFLSKDQDLINLWFRVKVVDYDKGLNTFYHKQILDRSRIMVLHFLLESGKAELNRRVSLISL